MTTQTVMFKEYLSIFDEVCTIELIRAPELDREKITQYIDKIQKTLKVHTYFMSENIKNVVTEILTQAPIRDYVFCTLDRFVIYLAGNDKISYTDLVRMFASICRARNVDDYKLLEVILPKAVADEISPDEKDVIGLLTANKMLIIPLMICMNITISEAPVSENKKKSS